MSPPNAFVVISNVLPKQTLRRDGRTLFGWSHWPPQSYYTPPIPPSKEDYIEVLLGDTPYMYMCMLGRTLISLEVTKKHSTHDNL